MDEMRPVRVIPLTRGLITIIDPDDWPLSSQYVWHAHRGRKTWYAYRQVAGGRQQGLHTLLTGQLGTDHKNGNGLDNRRLNLRVADSTQNHANTGLAVHNTSGFKGVSWHVGRGAWRAQIGLGGRRQHLGYAATPEEAALIYDLAAREHYGEFARLNFPQPNEQGVR